MSKFSILATLREFADHAISWTFRKLSQSRRWIEKVIQRSSARSSQKFGTTSEQRAQRVASLFLYSEYQQPYLRRIGDSIRALGQGIVVRNVDLQQESRRLRRVFLMAKDHGVGFHASPFRTEAFPGTMHHIHLAHGLDAGRFDGLGSFSSGAGRVLSKGKTRLYDFLLVSSPWSCELAQAEVPEYAGRVLVIGDWRADEIRDFAVDPCLVRRRLGIAAGVPVVGIASSHGPRSAFRQFGDQLFDLLREYHGHVTFLLFFHAYERTAQPSLYKAVSLLCEATPSVRIVGVADFELSLAACDLLISDYGSTSLYFSLLGRPMGLLPFDESFMRSDFPAMVLRNHTISVKSLRESRPLILSLLKTTTKDLSIRPTNCFIEKLYPTDLAYLERSKEALSMVFSELEH